MVEGFPTNNLFPELSGTQRLDALNKLAWERRSSESLWASKVVEYILSESIAEEYAFGEAVALATRALLRWQASDPQMALLDASRARLLLQSESDRMEMARCCTVLGLVQWTLGMQEAAWETWKECYFIYEEAGYVSGMANTLTNFANLLFEDGQHELAEVYGKEALELMESVNNWMGVGNLRNNLGVLALNRGAHQAAYYWLRKAVSAMRQASNWAGIAAIYENLAELRLDTGRPESARQFIALQERYNDRVGEAADPPSLQKLRYYADPRASLYNPEKALDIGKALLSLQIPEHDLPKLLECLVDVCLTLKDYSKALEYSKRLSEHWKSRFKRSTRYLLKRAEQSFRLSRGLDDRLDRGLVINDPKRVLTKREYEVFLCLGQGMISKEIGSTLSISPQTVQVHRRQIARKLNTRGSEISVVAVKYYSNLKSDRLYAPEA
jgi:DNA-binding CsgD family transcriptional regulator/tetratricopeptide (TPR) repeat protein